jgi:hypothetical protein
LDTNSIRSPESRGSSLNQKPAQIFYERVLSTRNDIGFAQKYALLVVQMRFLTLITSTSREKAVERRYSAAAATSFGLVSAADSMKSEMRGTISERNREPLNTP